MCFSEAASFTTGGALIAGGAFVTFKAAKLNRRYLPFALMPAMAGIQQIFEGHVWMGLDAGVPAMVWWAALGFMFFSWFMWPAWVPFSVYVLEPPESRRKSMFLLLAIAGVALGGILFVPHLLNADWIRVGVNNRSLAYEDTMFLDYFMPRWLTYLIYLSLIIVPTLLSTYLHVRWFGATLIVTLVVVYLFLSYAYISFFCLLAGLGTLHLIYIILRNKCCRECPVLFS